MSKTLIAGNWKMNLAVSSAEELATGVEESAAQNSAVEVAVFPSAHLLTTVEAQLHATALGIQNVYFADEGAFTGEIAAAQAAELVSYAIVGHSERRQMFSETDEMLARKMAACIRNGLTPILCVGETQHEREELETTQVLNDQLSTGLTMLTAEDVAQSVVAYEPVWAIGTGHNAKPEDVDAAIATIRHNIGESFGARAAESVRVLYGGSVDHESVGSYLDIDRVDGLLVGGASLDISQFSAIIERANSG